MGEYQDCVIRGRFMPVVGAGGFKAIRVRNGKIVELGSNALLEYAQRESIRVHDFGDKAVLPGIVDPHTHFEHLALGEVGKIDCRFSECQSIEHIVTRLRDRAADCDRDDWIRGYTNLFIDQMLADRRLPTRDDLDRVSRIRPVVLNCGGHVSVLNSVALSRLPAWVFEVGADGLWGAPVIGRSEDGAPNGIVAEIDGHIPQIGFEQAERTSIMLAAEKKYLLSRGVTTIGEMVENAETLSDWKARFEAGYQGRVSMFALWPAVGSLEEVFDLLTSFGSGDVSQRLRAVGVKAFVDGGYSSRNAAILTEYLEEARSRPHDRGRINLSYGQARELVRETRKRGLRLALHANGARAQLHVLNAILGEGDPYQHAPVRVEHLGNLLSDPHILELTKQANATPMVQPGFLWSFVGDFLSAVMGDAGRQGRLPLRTFRDESIATPFSSDMALGSMDRELSPFHTMMDAVSRRGFWGNAIDVHESLSFAEALELHTIEAARSLGLEDEVGSIEAGKAADLVVVDSAALISQDARLMQPETVFVDGSVVFERESL